MMAGYNKNYARTVAATNTLNDTAVEYIGGIKVIKVFGKAKSSYEKFVSAAGECAQSYIDWMNKSNFFFTFAVNIMPATLLSALPIGGLLLKNGTLTAAELVGHSPQRIHDWIREEVLVGIKLGTIQYCAKTEFVSFMASPQRLAHPRTEKYKELIQKFKYIQRRERENEQRRQKRMKENRLFQLSYFIICTEQP